MSTDMIPAGESGRYEITQADMVRNSATTLDAAEILLTAEAEQRGLNIRATPDIRSGNLIIEWNTQRED